MVGSSDEPAQLDMQAKCQQLKNELEGLRMASSDCINKLMAQISKAIHSGRVVYAYTQI